MTQMYRPGDDDEYDALGRQEQGELEATRLRAAETVTGNLEDGVPMAQLPKRPTTHTVDIALNHGDFGHVVLDGVDVGGCVAGVTAYVVPKRGPHVILELLPGHIAVQSDAAAVEVDGRTHDVLVTLGWTPPAAPKVPVATESNGVQD